MLTDEKIIKFQMLYKSRFKTEIGREEAIEKGERLIRLLKAVYQPQSVSSNNIKTEAVK